MKSTLLATLCAAALMTGCYSKAKGNLLARSNAEHEQRITALEEGIESERARIRDALDRAETKVAELQQVLEQATDVVTRNSADLGTEVRQLQTQLQSLEGQLAEIRNDVGGSQRAIAEVQSNLEGRISQIQRRRGADPEIPDSEIPEGATAIYAAAESAFEAGNYPRARGLWRAFMTRFPQSDRADDAAYQIGRAFVMQGRRTDAVRAFSVVIQRHSTGDIVPQTLLDMGDAYFQLRECARARDALNILVQTAPRSAQGREARTKLREIRNARRHCGS